MYRMDATVDLTLRVSDLLIPNTNLWDTSKVRRIFVEEDANTIVHMRVERFQPDAVSWGLTSHDCRNRTTKREPRAGQRAGTEAIWLLPIGLRTVLRLRAADRGTRAVAVGVASGSDVNGKLRSSRIRNKRRYRG
ncbi:hypothetical protein F2Q70_00040115 [Brassica cretica]|uniref:Uncharacterized protein n=1 Tax=Brassica cretica TaxID=69181 RepID=A0A8S9K478_BRACR|nr:hypothetical protein F2Q70_00040115 [Brassica cretica]